MGPVAARVRVRYAETDQMGVVYYANYLVWMEVGRAELYRQTGFSYRDMEADGYHLVVAEANCRYLSSARYDDEVVISTKLAGGGLRMPRFDYEMSEGSTGRKLAKGYTKHIWCGPDFRPRKLPEKYWHLFGMES